MFWVSRMDTSLPLDDLHRLPTPRTPLVGRAIEVETVVSLLTNARVPLVTLTGSGGVGKTRLALQVAHSARGLFADGVVFVDLSPVRDAALVLPTIAAVLGVRETGTRPLAEILAGVLRDRHLLLVLDNLEHVVDAAPDIATLMATCPSLTVLATSRVVLRLAAEQVVPVAPLRLPDTSVPPSLNQLGENEAVAFFLDRAHAADPAFALTNENHGTITALVHRLDGLPLAIELAAARLRAFSPEALLARLEHQLPLLSSGARDAPLRQRAMRDAIAWSHDLLTSGEQILFRRLAVFVGGFTMEGAEALLKGVVNDADAILDGIASLVDQSLLRRERSLDVEPRYRMLETVREFGLEQLAANGEMAGVGAAHAAYVLDLAEQSTPSFLGPEHRSWLDRLEAEQGNLRAALSWLEEAREPTHLLRLARALGHFWYIRGSLTEGDSWMARSLAHAEDIPRELKADALAWASVLAHRQLDTDAAVSLSEASLAEWQTVDELSPGWTFALFVYAIAIDHQGDMDRATQLLAEVAEGFRDQGATGSTGMAIVNLAFNMRCQGRGEHAQELAEQGLALLRAAGSPWGMSFALAVLGDLALDRSDHATAVQRYQESLAASLKGGDMIFIGDSLVRLGVVAAAMGNASRAVQLFGAAQTLRQHTSQPLQPYLQDDYETALLKTRKTLEEDNFTELWSTG